MQLRLVERAQSRADPEVMSLLSQMPGGAKNTLAALRNSWFFGSISSFSFNIPQESEGEKEWAKKL